MTLGLIIVILLVLSLAWANGANDISKGVATLVGNGTTSARRAIWWGTLWTLMGGAAATIWGSALIKTFSSGYLSTGFEVDMVFVASTMLGAAFWVIIATRLALPVSTTHALLGGVVGAALVAAGPGGLELDAVTKKALLPLLISPLIAIGLCAVLLLLMRYVSKKLPQWSPGCCEPQEWQKDPFVCATDETGQQREPNRVEKMWVRLHWLSSGVTSFARGLNDVPKIAAFLILALSLSPGLAESVLFNGAGPILLVALVMGVGCLWGGFRVLELLSHRVTPLDASSGLVANVGTSMLVLVASPLGLPVSTTHVSTGALMGVRWSDKAQPSQSDALKLVLYGWVVTLPIAAALAALSVWSIGLF